MQTDNSGKMVLFDQSLAFLVQQGKIDYESARDAAHFPDQLDYILETSGYEFDSKS